MFRVQSVPSADSPRRDCRSRDTSDARSGMPRREHRASGFPLMPVSCQCHGVKRLLRFSFPSPLRIRAREPMLRWPQPACRASTCASSGHDPRGLRCWREETVRPRPRGVGEVDTRGLGSRVSCNFALRLVLLRTSGGVTAVLSDKGRPRGRQYARRRRPRERAISASMARPWLHPAGCGRGFLFPPATSPESCGVWQFAAWDRP